MNRRAFLERSSLAAAAALLPFPGRLIFAADDRLRALRGGTGVFTEKGGTIGWYVADGGVVVVDTQYPETAPHCLEAVRSRTARKIDAVLNTHHHGDHTGGNGVFRDHAFRIVAQKGVPALQKAAAEKRGTADGEVYADTLFETTWKLGLGVETVHGRHFEPGHTGGDAVFHFEKANVTHLGDLVFNGMVPVIDRPGGAKILGWIRVLEQLPKVYPADTIWIYGHATAGADVSGGAAPLVAQRRYLEGLLDYVRKGKAAGKSVDEMANVDRIPGFPDVVPSWSTAIRSNVQAAFEELTGSDPEMGRS